MKINLPPRNVLAITKGTNVRGGVSDPKIRFTAMRIRHYLKRLAEEIS